ncbi:MAG: CARDB domain-containing protein, partial [Deltaproteobacteria bacterium]
LRDPLEPGQLMERSELSISTLGGPIDAPQSGSKELIKMTNLGTQPLRASCRDNRLSLSLNDSADWLGNGTRIQSNRLIQVDVGGFPALPAPGSAGYRERVFGLNNPLEDDLSAVFSYGWPVVETNHAGDIVLAYVRTGDTADPEIRFSTWMHSEADIRPSRLLKGGEKPYALSWASPGPLPWADTGGICVDPFDDTAVWFAHCYADSHSKDGNYAIQVGKVFGRRWPRYAVAVGALQEVRLRRHQRFTIPISIANAGDGPSPETRADVRLRGPRHEAIHVTELRIPPVPSGATLQFEVSVRLPRNVEEGMYDLEVAVDPHEEVKQYDRAGSTARRPVVVRTDDDQRDSH